MTQTGRGLAGRGTVAVSNDEPQYIFRSNTLVDHHSSALCLGQNLAAHLLHRWARLHWECLRTIQWRLGAERHAQGLPLSSALHNQLGELILPVLAGRTLKR